MIVRETTALAGSTTESLRNIELVKSLGLAQQEIERLNSTTAKILKLELKKVRYLRSLSFIQGTFVNLLRTSILFLMLYLIFTQRITVGQFFSLFIYSFFIFGPLQELGNVVNTYRETEASLENFETILAAAAGAAAGTSGRHRSARNAGFRPGRVPASIGHPARARRKFRSKFRAAKPSLSSGLRDQARRRWSSCWSGSTGRRPGTFSTTERARMRSRSTACARSIGFVTQDSQLFSGSIRENLLFVRPQATDAECMDVLRQASVDSLLARAERGLDTVIGEGGVKVSGGEKQRLSIARALLRKPQLLVFDEATSSLDSLTEEEISQTIRDVATSRDAITILIAHRLVDGAACRPDLRAGTRADRRVRKARRTDRAQRFVLRDVAAAGGRGTSCAGDPDQCVNLERRLETCVRF